MMNTDYIDHNPDLRVQRIDTAIWLLSLFCILTFFLATDLGTISILGFLVAMSLYVSAWPRKAVKAMLAYPVLWIFPGLAFLSLLWSRDPAASARAGAELLTTTGFGIVLATIQRPRSYILAFMCALLLAVILSTLFGGEEGIGYTGEVALHGLFGSKNNYAMIIGLLMISSMSVLCNSSHARTFRAIAWVAFLVCPFLIVLTRSTGGIISTGTGLCAVFLGVLSARLPKKYRPALVFFTCSIGAIVAAGLLLIISNGTSLDEVLLSLGKDPDLTGRTHIWMVAAELIRLHPMLGFGYQAFWIKGFLEPESLWRFMHDTTRSGVHFHNLYYETAIELGYIGVFALGLSLAWTMAKIVSWNLRSPGYDAAFFLGLFAFYASRAMTEVDFIGPFAYGSLLLPAALVYASCARPARLRRDRQPAGRAGAWVPPATISR